MEQLQAVVETRSGFRLDPRTKLLLMAVVATAEFLYSHTAFMIAVALIPFVLLLTNRQYKTAIVFFCLFTAGLFVQAVQNSIQFPMVHRRPNLKRNHRLYISRTFDFLMINTALLLWTFPIWHYHKEKSLELLGITARENPHLLVACVDWTNGLWGS